MVRNPLAAAAIFAVYVAAAPSAQIALASDGVCGHYAFAGAFSTRNAARKQARRVGGQVFDLDASDSPNAGKGLWVVGTGPGPRSWASKQARKFRDRGVRGAYVAARCMYG